MQTDVQDNYYYGTAMPLVNQDRCVYLLTSRSLASWVTSRTSRVLAINGNMNSAQNRSPLSFISARLVYTLDLVRARTSNGKDQVAAVHFFCGEHTDRGDRLISATAIINNLLAQLVSSFKDINLINLVAFKSFQSNDINAACKRFKSVLKLLPATAVVFCIVDNLPFYLIDEKTSKDTRTLLRWLIKLTRLQRESQEASGEGCTFKLLLTTAVQFMEPEITAVSDDNVINIPIVVPQTGGFSDIKWEMGVGSEIDNLG